MHRIFTVPWWLKIPLAALVVLLGIYPGILPDALAPWARPVAILLAVWIIGAASIHTINVIRENQSASPLKITRQQLILVLQLVAFGVVCSAIGGFIYQHYIFAPLHQLQPTSRFPRQRSQ